MAERKDIFIEQFIAAAGERDEIKMYLYSYGFISSEYKCLMEITLTIIKTFLHFHLYDNDAKRKLIKIQTQILGNDNSKIMLI